MSLQIPDSSEASDSVALCSSAANQTDFSRKVGEEFASNRIHEDVLAKIFSYLDYRDLQQVILANSEWNSIVREEMMKRCQPTWFRFGGRHWSGSGHLLKSRNFEKQSMELFFVVHQPCRNTSSPQDCFERRYFDEVVPFRKCFELENIPDDIKYCMSTFCYVNQTRTNNELIEFKCAYYGVSIPKIENLRIAQFLYDPLKPIRINNIVSKGEILKCCLIFGVDHLSNMFFDIFLDDLLDTSSPENVAVGGASPVQSYAFSESGQKECSREGQFFCIAFLQQEQYNTARNFNASSIVISTNDCNCETTLTEFKNSSALRENGIVFHFCNYFHNSYKEETKKVTKVFENYEIVSVHTSANRIDRTVFGWNCYPGYVHGTRNPRKNDKIFPKFYHRDCTSIVFITWGKKL